VHDRAVQPAPFRYERPETVAAIIAEPISTANGALVPPAEYWHGLRELCDEYGILLIADEVINGFGRTGKWFGIEHFGVSPDIMTMAKGLTSGYQPLAGAGTTLKVAERFVGKGKSFAHGTTFGTHPVATAVALANVQIIEREGLVANSARVGAYLKQQCESLMERHVIIGDVRGAGLMLQLELVKDRATHAPWEEEADLPGKLNPKLLERGLLTRAGGAINLAPPLVLNREEADEIVEIIDDALTEVERELAVG